MKEERGAPGEQLAAAAGSEFLCGACGVGEAAPGEKTPDGGLMGLEGDAEDAEPLRYPPQPVTPDPATVEQHRKTHLPFRSWCLECMMGRGLGEQRGRHTGRVHGVPIVGIDYWFITDGSLLTRSELKHAESAEGEKQLQKDREEGKVVKCIIIRCYATKCVFAHVVPCKGADEDNFAAKLVVGAVSWLGHTRLILKSDGEPAVRSLVKKSLEEIKHTVKDVEQASSERSAAYDSQSNGGTEVGVRTVRGLLRSLRLCLEKRLGARLPTQHPLMAWLVEHTALLLNACSRGSDGITPWERARGRPFGLRLHGFGESVLWKQPLKGPQHDVHGNLGPRQYCGVFLGYNKVSNTYRVLSEEGHLVKARGLTARPEEAKWNPEKLAAVTVTPWDLRRREAAVRVEVGEPVERHAAPAEAPTTNPRRLKITKHMLSSASIGTTDGCPQCRHFRTFGETKDGLPHTEACRARILEAMNQSDTGRAKLARHEERIDRAIAERIEAADAGARPAAHGENPETSLPSSSAATPPTPEPAYTAPAAAADSPDDDMEAEDAVDEDEDQEMMGCVTVQDEYLSMLGALGCPGKAFRREHRKACRRVLAEIYSPPRVTAMASLLPKMKLLPGFALDITCADPEDGQPWDFNDPAKRLKARERLRQEKPLFLVGSPMCTAWCTWQALNAHRSKDPAKMQRERVRARLHLDFVMNLYREQVEAGRFFLHEHPAHASSWGEDVTRAILDLPGVGRVDADQCQYGSEVTFGKYQGQPVKKPTGFMSNAPHLLRRLSKRCEAEGKRCSRRQGGEHALCSGKVAKEAAKYSDALCKAMLRGMYEEMRERGIVNDAEVGLHAVTDDADGDFRTHDPRYSGRYRDDLTGQVLRDDLVRAARVQELTYFKDKGVWLKRPKAEARQVTGRLPITVRWVDVNKGDELNPRYRSRLVARQLKAHDRSGASFFAPTPPLEALRTVLSLAASTVGEWKPSYDPKSARRMQISLMDISRAYFNAKCDDKTVTYVNLPPEDRDAETMCARLLRHMYGTRAAADGWQEEYSSFLVEVLGFVQGTASPCLFKHPNYQIVLSVHGDDFTAAGPCEDLDWFEQEMQKHYELTLQPRLGPGPHDAREAIVLNRVIRWTQTGIELEADPRQAEKLIAECGLEGVNTVATPGVRASYEQLESDKPLADRLHTAFRGAAARANYLAADRLDCQFAAKEVCRFMAKPTEASWCALKRLCRYLVGLPRLVYKYRWQSVSVIDVYTDTDWAGCPRTRKSTSGGCVMLGTHTIKTWSSTQSSVALSSGEAEFNGVVKGAGVGLGYRSLLGDLGHSVPLRVWTDSSAAIGISSRQGLGKLRHLDTHTLWIQQAVRAGQVDLRKVDGEVNPADVFTKHSLSRERLMALTRLFEVDFRSGRAASAAQTRKGAGTRRTIAEADEEVCAMGEEGPSPEAQSGQRQPRMPHLEHDAAELDRLYPSFEAPEAADVGDPQMHATDSLLDHGLKVAENIMKEAAEQGRRRVSKGPEEAGGGTPATRHPTAREARSCRIVREKGVSTKSCDSPTPSRISHQTAGPRYCRSSEDGKAARRISVRRTA